MPPEWVTFKLGFVVFNCLHNQAPQYLVDLCQSVSSVASRQQDWNWETIFTDIIGLYSTNVTYLASKAIKFSENRKIRAITPFKVIEVGISRKPVCDFLLVINSK